jgi:predicted nucleic acid-binding protein
MQILVSDTSVIIDLERANLLENVFASGLALVMPDLLFEREFGADGQRLTRLGLKILSLDSDELAFAQTSHLNYKALSLPDCFALALSARQNHVLLTGDKALRQIAEGNLIVCHGVLWLFDEMARTKSISKAKLARGLRELSLHPRCRLPKAEISLRLKQWQLR